MNTRERNSRPVKNLTRSDKIVSVRNTVNLSKHVTPRPPTHAGPPAQSFVITTKIPPITVSFNGQVRSWSRHEVARHTGWTPSAVSLIFAGKRNLTMPTAIRLAQLFNCTLDHLVFVVLPSTINRVREVTNTERAQIMQDNVQSGGISFGKSFDPPSK